MVLNKYYEPMSEMDRILDICFWLLKFVCERMPHPANHLHYLCPCVSCNDVTINDCSNPFTLSLSLSLLLSLSSLLTDSSGREREKGSQCFGVWVEGGR